MSKTASAATHIQTLNITPGRGGFRVARDKYDATRKAILEVVRANGEGVLFSELPRAVARKLPKALFANASVPWYTTVVKLDLEARGEIERVPGAKPQRLRRVNARVPRLSR
jgi:hypothetical protein